MPSALLPWPPAKKCGSGLPKTSRRSDAETILLPVFFGLPRLIFLRLCIAKAPDGRLGRLRCNLNRHFAAALHPGFSVRATSSLSPA